MTSYFDLLDSIKIDWSMPEADEPRWDFQVGEDAHLSNFITATIWADDCGEHWGFVSCWTGDEEHGASVGFAGANDCDENMSENGYLSLDTLVIDLCIETIRQLTDAYALREVTSSQFEDWTACLTALVARTRRNYQ